MMCVCVYSTHMPISEADLGGGGGGGGQDILRVIILLYINFRPPKLPTVPLTVSLISYPPSQMECLDPPCPPRDQAFRSRFSGQTIHFYVGQWDRFACVVVARFYLFKS